ncbi:MAG: RagB/SusD family nutrient uptake outer membrane protein [Bacteroidales bacterium]|nr:RagB/SusD family nutrient uptake outer membrane protein [Bacteroidales bacterium]
MNKKYILSSVAALVGLSLATSCVDMDTEPEGSTVTSEQKADVVAKDAEKAAAAVTAIFANFTNYQPNYGYLGSQHNDFGYPSIMLLTDTEGEDMIVSDAGYNWFSYGLDFSSRVANSRATYIVWSDLYSLIYTANAVSGVIDPATDNAESQFNLAQALGARAFAYFQLVQLYAFNYQIVDPATTPAVPIITDANASSAASAGAPRASVAEVYDQIYADIDATVSLLTASQAAGYKRADIRYIDLAVAYGLRARINLVKGNKTAAAADAQAAIDNTTATPKSLADATGPSFNDRNENDWMWGVLIEESDDVVSSGIVNWVSHIGTMNYGYGEFNSGYRISKKLYQSLSETDVRRTWFLDENGENAALSDELYQSLANYDINVPYMNTKFAPYKYVPETEINANDIPLMRVEEMYYILAEANGSQAILEDFVKTYRDPNYSLAMTGNSLPDEIWRQRRIEFWGEGMNWFDIMRLNKGIDRRNTAALSDKYILNVPAGSNILLWPIPQPEIEANVGISETDQNACVTEAYSEYKVDEDESVTLF